MFRMDVSVSKSQNIQWELIENKAVLLNIDEAILLQLDDMGTKIWLMIDGNRSAEDIVGYLTAHFQVEKSRVERDARRFLKKLIRDEAIEIGKKED